MVAFYLFLYPPQKWRRHFCDGRFFSATINPTLLSLRLGCVDKYIFILFAGIIFCTGKSLGKNFPSQLTLEEDISVICIAVLQCTFLNIIYIVASSTLSGITTFFLV